MKLKGTVVVAALVAAVGLTGCDDGEVTGIVIADLAGTWDANTLTFSPTDAESESTAIPFVALGGDLVVTIESNGAFDGTLTVPGAVTGGDPVDLPVSGSMALVEVDDEELIDVNFDATTEATFAQAGLPFEDFDGPFSLSGSQLTITNETDFDFDFDDQTPEEAALLTLVLVRTST